jgi:predicted nucleic acid-binding protein
MHKIISNTTPIISLLKVDKLNLLKELYEKIIVPKAVYLEVENGKEKPYYHDLTQIDWIEIQEIGNHDSRDYFLDLDEGEAEVLILAKELNADLIIMDEIMGRRYSKQLGFNLTGTIGILLKAKENGLIESIKDLLTELAKKGTWLSLKLITKAIELANEK